MTEPVIDYARTKSIAAAIQNKTRATCRVHPGEDRISIKDPKTGEWRDYTADSAARGYNLSAFLKDAKPVMQEYVEPPDDDAPPATTTVATEGPVGRINQPKHELEHQAARNAEAKAAADAADDAEVEDEDAEDIEEDDAPDEDTTDPAAPAKKRKKRRKVK